jgi:hypothetical protein
MTPPPEYRNYLNFLGFDDIDPDTYTIYASTKVFRFHPISDAIPDAAYSWDSISMALEWGLLLRVCKRVDEVVNIIEGLASQGIWMEGFPTEEVWRRAK